jgi:hypothetical protein
MAKVVIESGLYERAKKAAGSQGYSTVDEFVTHAIENELKRLEVAAAEEEVTHQLRGLGYIE